MNLKGITKIVLWLACSALSFSSCIKEEAENAEADILGCTVNGDLLIREPVVTNTEVKLYVNGWEDLTNLAPVFTLTGGARIEPASGTPRDFTTPQTYTVTSQDGRWKKSYKVSFISGDLATEYHFENVRFHETTDANNPSAPPKKFFHIFYDQSVDGSELVWGSGNAGYMITHSSYPAADYPTSQAEEGYRGKCVKLVTRPTGFFESLMGAPMAAGNLFIGEFKVDMSNMAKSTRFGAPFRKKPTGIEGYYKYKAGATFKLKNGTVVADRKDIFDIYAVLYEVTDDLPYLDGTNVKTHPNIVMIAQVEDRKETDDWTRFLAKFKLQEGKEIDEEKLHNGKYNLAIVMSSSDEGAIFNGAIGSTLYVDEVNLYYE